MILNGVDFETYFKNYPDERIITLEEAISICRKYSMRPMIEVKGGTPEDMRGLLTAIRMMGVNDALVIDFNSDRIRELRRLDSEIELWYLVSKANKDTVEFVKENAKTSTKRIAIIFFIINLLCQKR